MCFVSSVGTGRITKSWPILPSYKMKIFFFQFSKTIWTIVELKIYSHIFVRKKQNRKYCCRHCRNNNSHVEYYITITRYNQINNIFFVRNKIFKINFFFRFEKTMEGLSAWKHEKILDKNVTFKECGVVL